MQAYSFKLLRNLMFTWLLFPGLANSMNNL